MNIRITKFIIVPLLLIGASCNTPAANENVTVLIKTTLGDVKIKLYDGTPLHRDNFIALVKSGFYEGISFHRVIQNFMIQAGDPATKSSSGKASPDSIYDYTIPAEFNPLYFHKKGAVAAARQGNETNPYMRSSGTQFYIVQGTKYTEEELLAAEQRINNLIKQSLFTRIIKETTDSLRLTGKAVNDAEVQELASVEMFYHLSANKDHKLTPEQKLFYKTTGGTPRLDCTYTVFGEVTEGLEIVDKIAAEKTDASDKPLNNIIILKMKIIRN